MCIRDRGTARSSLSAYQVLTTHLSDTVPYWRTRMGEPQLCPGQLNPGDKTPPQEWIAFHLSLIHI